MWEKGRTVCVARGGWCSDHHDTDGDRLFIRLSCPIPSHEHPILFRVLYYECGRLRSGTWQGLGNTMITEEEDSEVDIRLELNQD